MPTSTRAARATSRALNQLDEGQLRADAREVLAVGLVWLLFCALVALCAGHAHAQTVPASTAARPAPNTYVVSVVPQFPAVDINRTWAPLLERLGKDTGATFVLRVARDIPSFEEEFRAGDPDFVYLNPYHQLVAHKLHGYIPLVRDSEPLKGLLVVRQDGPIRQPRDLQGQTIAFPAPHAFGASIMVRATLGERERVQFQTLWARTHTNAYRQVVAGMAVAAGGLRATLDREPEALRQQLRVLMETPGSAPHPLSAHPRVPPELRQAVTRAWLRMAQDPALQASLKDIPMAHPMAADHDRDYAPLAELHFDRYID